MRAWAGGTWALALALLLLPAGAPAAQAAAPIEALSTHLDLSRGNATSDLVGAVLMREGCSGMALVGAATHLRLEVDRHKTPVTFEGNPLSVTVTNATQTSHDSYDDVRLALVDAGPTCRVMAWTEGGAHAAFAFPTGAFHLDAAEPVTNTYTGQANGTRSIAFPGAGNLQAQGSAGPAVAWGDLHLAVWDATLQLTAGGHTTTLQLGEHYEASQPADGGPALPGPFKQLVESEAFLALEGAHLQASLPQPAQLLARGTHIDAPAGRVDLAHAVLPGKAEVPVYSITAPLGDVRPVEQAAPSGTQTVLGATFAPNTKTAVLDRAITGAGVPLWSLWVAAGALLALLVLRRWAIAAMREAADAEAWARAARLARLVWPSNAESRTTRVACLLKLGDLDGAERALRVRGWRAQEATRNFLRARLEASRGDPAAARRHLAECLLVAPAFVADARSDPALHGIVEGALALMRSQQAREGYA